MNKNKLHQSVLLTAIVVMSLPLLSLIPAYYYETIGLRDINIFSDIAVTPIDSPVAVKHKKQPIHKDSIYKEIPCPDNLICIEDFSEKGNGMDYFLTAIDSLKLNGRPLHIAFFGDSYIEGDMVVGELRDTMQAAFGGQGIGFCPTVSEVAGFRQTIIHSFSKDWTTTSFIDEQKSKTPFGISGHVHIPAEGSYVRFAPVNKRNLNSFKYIKIYYSGAEGDYVEWQQGKSNPATVLLEDGNRLHQTILELNSKLPIKIKFTQSGSLKVYGFSIEGDSGVYIDNFAMRGNSGIGLAAVQEKMYKQFDSLRHYDLIIMEFGLNVANSKTPHYEWYERSMKNALQHMKHSFPNSSMLMLSVGDRGGKVDGEMKTMKGIKELIESQQLLSEGAEICFWNLFEAMGGESSMVNLVNKKMANKDYTHLTFSGGRFVAYKISQALFFEIYKHEQRKKHEAGKS